MSGNDTNPNEPIQVTCCFCGGDIRYEHATKLIVEPPGEDAGDQVLYCHGPHLRDAILDTVPLHPNVTDLISGEG